MKRRKKKRHQNTKNKITKRVYAKKLPAPHPNGAGTKRDKLHFSMDEIAQKMKLSLKSFFTRRIMKTNGTADNEENFYG